MKSTANAYVSSSEDIEEEEVDHDLPEAKEVTLTSEEFDLIETAECLDEEIKRKNDRTAFSMTKGEVGAAIVGGVLGGLTLGVVGAIALGGGAAYAATKSNNMEKTGEKVYKNLSKAGKATGKGLKKAGKAAKAKYLELQRQHQIR